MKPITQLPGFFLLLLVGLGCVSCSRPTVQERELEDVQKFPLVKTIEILPVKTVQLHSFTAFAREGQTTRLSFRVPGPLIELSAEIGKKVTKGTCLAKIDPRDFELAVRQVSAGLAEANAALKAMRTGARPEDLAALEAQVAAMKSQLETTIKNEERFAKLIETKSVPQIKYDEMKLHRDQAQAAFDAASRQLEKGQKGARSEEIEAMEAKILGLKLTLEKAQNALADSAIYAPSDGCVSQKFLENGEIAAPGVPVLVFTDLTSILVETTIPESILLQQEHFEDFACEFEAYPGVRFPAKLHELGQALPNGKPGWPMVVEVESDAGHPLHPGMTGAIFLSITQPEKGIFVPAAALVGNPQSESEYSGKSKETLVWLVDDRFEVHKKSVSILRATESGMEIQGDFLPGDRIVTAGARFLHDGERVRLAP